MTFTYDVGTLSGNLARVRLLIRDTDSDNAIFQDEEIDVFLSLEGDNLKRAAAMAYEVIAGNEAYIQKVQTVLNTSTDGAKLADALRAQAALWRKQAADEEATADGGAFDWAEMVVNGSSYLERIGAQALRGN